MRWPSPSRGSDFLTGLPVTNQLKNKIHIIDWGYRAWFIKIIKPLGQMSDASSSDFTPYFKWISHPHSANCLRIYPRTWTWMQWQPPCTHLRHIGNTASPRRSSTTTFYNWFGSISFTQYSNLPQEKKHKWNKEVFFSAVFFLFRLLGVF